ncbi:FAD-dependent oxidoreductase [Bacillus sp. BH2]|uniref:FAD-dependent monooxygenase n=1 Tax=unclassified Bacillus (in: firmicutes) TaxID=185979 RepID=UPI0008FDACE8|nr:MULTISPECIES: FAD-dependent monooxygenase [unclassified Bacillus (in: firmicutes)]OJD59111.1 monooxygenase FAD-binding protein [Bacillus sp. N35-10-4]TEA45991.1 FAD-dependent oxidoreductase [Bacillus sp. BH2]
MLTKDVVIVGSGPGGALLGYLLAKSGIDVLVIEKSATLKRNFRGETIAPGSVSLLKQLGLFDKIPKDQYLKVQKLLMYDKDEKLLGIDFKNFNHEQKYGIDMPQPTILNVILKDADQFENFSYWNDTTCMELTENEAGEVDGVICKKGSESLQVKSRLVVGADGRFSTVRKLSKLQFEKNEYDRDLVFWFKVPKPEGWPEEWKETSIIKVDRNNHLILLPTFPNLLRVGMYIENNGISETYAQGIETFREKVIALEPRLEEVMQEHIKDWNDTSLLKIFTTFAPKWSRDGLVLIGDAAHTLSPVLGQGVNVAMQDAVELAPYIIQGLQKEDVQAEPLKHELFIEFEEKRKKIVSFISNFQEEQENGLAAKTDQECKERVIKMKMLDNHPLKYQMMSPIQYGIALEN